MLSLLPPLRKLEPGLHRLPIIRQDCANIVRKPRKVVRARATVPKAADVKPESDATLAEIAKLLQQTPGLKLYVVGHTDNVGTLASNLDLSKRRGDAVVKVLSTRYSIAATRLSSQGDGPTAPVASNESEEGRAKNRRVELVKQ